MKQLIDVFLTGIYLFLWLFGVATFVIGVGSKDADYSGHGAAICVFLAIIYLMFINKDTGLT